MSKCKITVAALVIATALFPSCRSRRATGDVVAEVNGRPILATDLDKFYNAQRAEATANQQKVGPEQERMEKLIILRALIDNDILLQRAEKMGLLATDAEVETKFAERKSPYSDQEFNQQLKQRGLTIDDLKNDLRRELSLEKVFNKEIRSRVQITEAEIAKTYEENKASFNVAETRFHIAQIVVTPDGSVPVANLKNDKARNEAEARREIEGIAQRLRNGEDFGRVAQELSEDPGTARNSGDLGFVPASGLEKAEPALRNAILALMPGNTSGVVQARDGYYILKLIEKQVPGQRQIKDPAVQQEIRTTLENRKGQLLREAYMEVARNESKIVNYYARRMLEAAGTPK